MKISDLKKGQKVTIRCKHKTLLVDMEARVAGVRSEVVLLELIRHDGQIVDFSSPHVHIITIMKMARICQKHGQTAGYKGEP